MADDTISVKVTADADGLIDVFGKATVEVGRLSDQLQKLDKDGFSGLSDAFKSGQLDADEFRDGLHKLTAEAQQMAAATKLAASINGEAAVASTAAGEAAHLSAGGMRELVVVAREIASGNLTRLPGSLSILATRLGGISPVAILAAAAIAGIGYAIYEAIESSEKFEAQLATIQNSLTAVGSGNSFDRTEITAYIDELRQIPGVDRDAAASIENEFSRSRNIGGDMMRQLIADIVPFSELIGKKVPDAAKDMAAAFNDPVKGLQLLKAAGVEVSASTSEQITQMMAVNDLAGAQQVLLNGISDAMSHMVDNSTGLTKFWNDLKLSLSGVNEEAAKTRDSLLAAAAAAEQAGDASQAKLLRYNASMYESRTRNLPNSNWSGSSGTMQQGDDKQGAKDKEEQAKKDNDAVSATNKLFDTGNSLLAEQERHKHNIQVIQEGINAAERLNDDAAVKRGYADLETENKQYYGEPKEPKKKKAPKDNTDRDMERELAQEQRDAEKLGQATADADEKSGAARLKTEQALIQQKAALHQIDADTEFQQLSEVAAKELALERAKFDALAKLYKDDAAKQEEIAGQRVQAEQKHDQEMIKLSEQLAKEHDQAAKDSQAAWQKSVAPITRAFDTSIQGMVQGTQTLHQAVSRIGQSIVSEFVGNVIHTMVDNWLLGELQKTAASEIGAKARQLADSEGTNQSVQDNIKNTGKQQETDAVGVFSSVFNYLAPELGPFAAIPAGVASAAVLALSLPSAAGGMIVPNDTLAMVHENEMVLPARYTSGLTNMIDQANGGGGGSGHTFNTTVHANGRLNASDLDGLHDAVVSTMKKAARNGQFGGMRT